MLRISKTDLESIVNHCRREYPNEACGILAGGKRFVEKVYPMTNSEPGPAFYLMEPAEQFLVMKEMRIAGRELVGIYHSHTGSRAFPSGTDVDLAYYPEAVYVIVSLMDRTKPVVKGFSIVERRISEVPLDIAP